jgi:cytochrome P450
VAIPFVDTFDPAYDLELHERLREARERSWYATTPVGIVVLTHEAVRELVLDRRWHELGAEGLRMAGIESGPLWDWFHQIMSTQEGEPHHRLRRLVSKAFTPRSVERLRPAMRAVADELVDGFVARGRCELVEEFAAPFPVRVIGDLIGVPPEDFKTFAGWSDDLSLAFGNEVAGRLAEIEAALVALSGYVDGLIEARRSTPGDDLISALIAVEEEGDRLSTEELNAMVTVLIFGGQDTTQCQLACAVATFAEHPDQWARLAVEPSLAPSAAEEVLRYEPAGSGSPRIASEDMEFRGLSIARGTVALPSAPSANRDPAVYEDPDRFDIGRRHPEPQLTFGGGIHHCLGAALARAELQEALPLLARRLPGLALDGEVVWRTQVLIRGPQRLPIRFAPAP